ncbi:30S ribosomal protein S4e, partial [Archaeoglobales archaeon]
GEIGKLKDFKVVRSSSPNLVTVESRGTDITTIIDYIFVVGKKGSERPVIDLGV